MRIKVHPVDGRLVRHPVTGRRLAEAGESVVQSSYWTRLAAVGDVRIETPGDSTVESHGARRDEGSKGR